MNAHKNPNLIKLKNRKEAKKGDILFEIIEGEVHRSFLIVEVEENAYRDGEPAHLVSPLKEPNYVYTSRNEIFWRFLWMPSKRLEKSGLFKLRLK